MGSSKFYDNNFYVKSIGNVLLFQAIRFVSILSSLSIGIVSVATQTPFYEYFGRNGCIATWILYMIAIFQGTIGKVY